MSAVDFEVLKLIPKMLEEIEKINTRLSKVEKYFEENYDLTKRRGVIKYLQISNSTLEKYMLNGVLKQGYHFYRDLKGKKSNIRFVSGAIEEFKKEKTK